MKRRAFSLKMAQQSAELLLRNERITSLPVDPFAIAKSRDIVVEAKPDTAEGVSGMLLRHGDSFGIMYATHIDSEGFQRFSLSHELGHYFLDGHIDQVLPKDGTHVSHAGFVTNDPFELEADHFAAGLLMPSGPFKREIRRHAPGLAAVLATAKIAHTSRTSAAIRYAETMDEAVAIVISTGSTIDYCFMSEAMKSLPELKWLRKGTELPSDTATLTLASDRQRVLAGDHVESEVDVMDWLGGRTSALVSEQAIGLGRYGKVLTILHSRKIGMEGYEDDEINDLELEERWTPRFHR
jgi:Zn-dependent peptidase ImmA (M78 family)